MNTEPKQILRRALKDFFGFDSFKGLQEPIIENIFKGNDTFVIMPTGAGKSLCYQLPAIIKEGTAIVISPLIALMKNQVDSIRAYSGTDDIAGFLNSSMTKGDIRRVKENITNGITKLLYVAPESLGKQEYIDFFKGVNVSFVAVDEAHCISEWGHDFRPEYRRIKLMVDEIGRIPIMALTATATPKVQTDIQKNLGISDAMVFKSSFNRQNLYYEIRPKVDTEKSIIKYIKENPNKTGIIYCLSRKKTEELSALLQVNGINALPYHAGLDSDLRVLHQDKFLMEACDIIVATIAFGMGIDKPDVRFVIHYDIPKSIESYYQETGRAGRDGMEGVCLAYYCEKDIEKLQKFMKDKSVSEKEIGSLLIKEVVNYVECASCRRKQILNYFGEEFDTKNCPPNGCDYCRYPPKKVDAQSELILLLETIKDLGKKFNAEHLIDYVAGIQSDSIIHYSHQLDEDFGAGDDKDLKFWESLMKYALLYGFLDKDIENYGLIRINAKGLGYLKSPTDFSISLDHDYSQAKNDIAVFGGTESADTVLFGMLRELRKKLSKQLNLPPHIIFQDPSLEDMATQYPITTEDLIKISGVGQGKAIKFGKDFTDVIAKYVEENEIIRPTDLVMKSTPNKSSGKVFIISAIDRKIDLYSVASSRNLTFNELLNEIYAILNSGTKLNIDYFINEHVEIDVQKELYDYFRTVQTDDIEVALREIGADYSQEEIELIRIKFASEQGH